MKPPIFIVGVPRSGTTLLAAMLSGHSNLSCGPETGFFRKLAAINSDDLIKPDTWPAAAVDFIAGIKHSGFTGYEEKRLLEKYQLEPKQIQAFLAQKSPSISAALASVSEQYMTAIGKKRWVEKTPDHIQYLASLRKYFPVSPILHIVRDPRDVALSLTTVPWGAQSYFEALLFWKKLEADGSRFLATDNLNYQLRFEDLLLSPQETLIKVCNFIDETFEDKMLDTSVTGKNVNSRQVPWKAKASQPIDPSRIAVWRNATSASDNKVAEALLGDKLSHYGYPKVESFQHSAEVFPGLNLAIKYQKPFSALTNEQSINYWSDAEKQATVYLGDPAADRWFGGHFAEKLGRWWQLLTKIIRDTQSKPVYWILGEEETRWTGATAGILKLFLKPYRVKTPSTLLKIEDK